MRNVITLLFAVVLFTTGMQAGDVRTFPGTRRFVSPDGKLAIRDIVEAEEEHQIRRALVAEDITTGKTQLLISFTGTAAVQWSPDSRNIVATFYNDLHEGYIAIVGTGARGGQTPFDSEMMGSLLPAHERRFNDNEHISIESQGWNGNDAVLFSVAGRGHHDPHGFRMACVWYISKQKMDCRLLR
jgi:hypothetical protein